MDTILQNAEAIAVPYIATSSSTWREHNEHLAFILEQLKYANLTVNAKRCHFGKAELVYLDHIVGQGYRRPVKVKVLAMNEFPHPNMQAEVRFFLGLIGYGQRFIPNYAHVASLLTDALHKEVPKIVS